LYAQQHSKQAGRLSSEKSLIEGDDDIRSQATEAQKKSRQRPMKVADGYQKRSILMQILSHFLRRQSTKEKAASSSSKQGFVT